MRTAGGEWRAGRVNAPVTGAITGPACLACEPTFRRHQAGQAQRGEPHARAAQQVASSEKEVFDSGSMMRHELTPILYDRSRMCHTPARSVSEVAIFLAYASG